MILKTDAYQGSRKMQGVMKTYTGSGIKKAMYASKKKSYLMRPLRFMHELHFNARVNIIYSCRWEEDGT
jgi:hypothetical protein